jgi:malate/lactate dehydrogenase
MQHRVGGVTLARIDDADRLAVLARDHARVAHLAAALRVEDRPVELNAALAHGDDAPWPASVLLEGEYGIEGIALSVPVTLGPGGVREIHEWPLTGDEAAALRRAAEVVGAAAGDLSTA